MTALETMAAAARPPGLGDARVPCPLCGGLIHPVAGRCKHCKEDLSQFRAGRPQAAAALPALNGARPATSRERSPAHARDVPGTNGHAPAIPVAIRAREGSQPILPPRPTGRSMRGARAARALWKSWPMLVIGVAVLAIVDRGRHHGAAAGQAKTRHAQAARRRRRPSAWSSNRCRRRRASSTCRPDPVASDPWARRLPAPIQPQQARDPQAHRPTIRTPDRSERPLRWPRRRGRRRCDVRDRTAKACCEKTKPCPNVDQTMLQRSARPTRQAARPTPPELRGREAVHGRDRHRCRARRRDAIGIVAACHHDSRTAAPP